MSQHAQKLFDQRMEKLKKKNYAALQKLIDDPIIEEVTDNDGEVFIIGIRCFRETISGPLQIKGSIVKMRDIQPWGDFWQNMRPALASDQFVVAADRDALRE